MNLADFISALMEPSRVPNASRPRAGPSFSALPDAMGVLHGITADPEAYRRHEELVSSHPELYSRSLVKHRRYADALTDQLRSWGATPAVARQAAELGLACFYAGQATAGDDPTILARHVERAFDRLGS